ncbi:GNAT family N-acetyltransferase [Aquamicrobium segne]|uniref:GNAT family N-acetyltransferase n=1 Tax=Aquamicrobium segne TaxID=469547 RepID=A0ABW0GYM0_9HYPH
MVAAKENIKDYGDDRIDCPILVTERLVMRPPHEVDVDDLVDLANNRRIAEMLGQVPHPYGQADARAFIANSKVMARSGVTYALTLADNGALLGCAGLTRNERGLELGYWIGEPHWGKGYATEAAHALVDLAFRASDINTLHASCRIINPASRRVIHKCGFQYAGQGVLDSLVVGKVPVERYRLDRRTWSSLRSWARV